MLAAKSFEETHALPALERWMGILAEELADRLAEDSATHSRRPRLLTLYYRCLSAVSGRGRQVIGVLRCALCAACRLLLVPCAYTYFHARLCARLRPPSALLKTPELTLSTSCRLSGGACGSTFWCMQGHQRRPQPVRHRAPPRQGGLHGGATAGRRQCAHAQGPRPAPLHAAGAAGAAQWCIREAPLAPPYSGSGT